MPRAPKEKQTPEERAEKYRLNSSRSCSPKSATDKAFVAKNSYKHGFRAETLLTSIEDDERLKKLKTLLNLHAQSDPDAHALAWYLEKANTPDTLRRIMRNGPPSHESCVEELRARVDEELTILKAREEYLRVHIEEPSRKGATRRKHVLEGEAGARMCRYLPMNETAFHRNLRQLENEDQGIGKKVSEERTCDATLGSPNKANVPEMVAPNKANVPETVATNKAKPPAESVSGKDDLESSAERDSEVSALVALEKSLKIREARRETESFANPADQFGSVDVGRFAQAHGVGLPPEGGGSRAATSDLIPSG